MQRTRIAAGLLACTAVAAHAQPATSPTSPMAPVAAGLGEPPSVSTAPSAPPTHRLNLRVGLASSDEVRRPTVCLEVVAWWSISAEACGTGSGILHDEVGRQLAHFRLNVPIRRDAVGGGWTALRGGIGFAELEVGPDRPGFDFGQPDQPGSVAGPDASMSLQWLRPLGSGVELVATATVGTAWFSGADRLVIPQSSFQPYAALEIGAGW